MKFRVMLEGENFLVALDATEPRKHGFFVTAHLETHSEEEAEKQAIALVTAHDTLRKLVRNRSDDLPRVRTEKTTRLEEWPDDVTRPLTGLAWYEEEKA